MRSIASVRRLFVFFAAATALHLSPARGQAACPESREVIENARMQVMEADATTCWLTIDPDWEPSFVYRSYLFDNKGFMMIFNSYGLGSDDETTGARELMFFPRGSAVEHSVKGNVITIRLANGAELDFDASAMKWAGARGVKLQEIEAIVPSNKGGVEIKPESGLMLDFGFKLGGSPSAVKSGKARFTDAAGTICQVKNSDVVKWSSDGDVSLKFKDDAALFKFVRGRCPMLKF